MSLYQFRRKRTRPLWKIDQSSHSMTTYKSWIQKRIQSRSFYLSFFLVNHICYTFRYFDYLIQHKLYITVNETPRYSHIEMYMWLPFSFNIISYNDITFLDILGISTCSYVMHHRKKKKIAMGGNSPLYVRLFWHA